MAEQMVERMAAKSVFRMAGQMEIQKVDRSVDLKVVWWAYNSAETMDYHLVAQKDYNLVVAMELSTAV